MSGQWRYCARVTARVAVATQPWINPFASWKRIDDTATPPRCAASPAKHHDSFNFP
ncbi:hypothetical protein BO443_130022 [Burkholderia orbicola]